MRQAVRKPSSGLDWMRCMRMDRFWLGWSISNTFMLWCAYPNIVSIRGHLQGLAQSKMLEWQTHTDMRYVAGHKQVRRVSVTMAADLTSWDSFLRLFTLWCRATDVVGRLDPQCRCQGPEKYRRLGARQHDALQLGLVRLLSLAQTLAHRKQWLPRN